MKTQNAPLKASGNSNVLRKVVKTQKANIKPSGNSDVLSKNLKMRKAPLKRSGYSNVLSKILKTQKTHLNPCIYIRLGRDPEGAPTTFSIGSEPAASIRSVNIRVSGDPLGVRFKGAAIIEKHV